MAETLLHHGHYDAHQHQHLNQAVDCRHPQRKRQLKPKFHIRTETISSTMDSILKSIMEQMEGWISAEEGYEVSDRRLRRIQRMRQTYMMNLDKDEPR